MPLARTTIFTKEARAGSVKTRLCPPLTPEQASTLAQAMFEDTLEKCLSESSFETALCVHPPESLARFRALDPRVAHVDAQEGASLGERLASHFERVLSSTPRTSEIVIGSDAPHVPLELLREAHRELQSGAELVLGPDAGGGYYLVGLARRAPELFTRVTMSSGDMFQRTLELARSLGLSTHLLAVQRDVDREEDARWLLESLLADEQRHARGAGREFAACPRTRVALTRSFECLRPLGPGVGT